MVKNEGPTGRRRRRRLTDATGRRAPSSDQAPGEEAVQVNDKYRGGGAPPSKYPLQDDQHHTGG